MPARQKKIRHDDNTRAKIQAAMIINRLQDCVAGKITLDAQQVSAAKTLLAKTLPDLKHHDHSGNEEDGSIGITFKTVIERRDG